MKWVVKWKSPEFPSLKSPLEIQIVKAPEPPTKVRIEVWESDAQKFEVDDYHDKRLPEDHDDLIARFEGTLTPHPDRTHGFLFADLDGKPEFSGEQGSDHVFLRFEGEAEGKKYKCPIPATSKEPTDDTDGEFYELYFLLFDADAPAGSKPLVRSHAHFVRRRTDVLLGVEPLNQATANLNNNSIGKRILERFYGDKGLTANRQWGNIVLQVRGRALTVNITSSGCSYTTMTMISRYLRIPKPGTPEGTAPQDIEWTSLFDRAVGKSMDADCAPWEIKKFKKIPRQKEIKGLAKKVKKENAGKWVELKAKDAGAMGACPAGDGQRPVDNLVVRRKSLPAHWYVPRLVWWVRQGDGNNTNPANHFLRGQMQWAGKKKGGAVDVFPMVDKTGNPVHRYGFPNETSNGFARKKDSLLFPPASSETPQLYKGLGIKSKTHQVKNDPKWADKVVKHLRRGLPVLAHFKSGRFLKPDTDPGGHYILIVGFRTVNGRKRFIVNDPAGAKKLQYEVHFEDEMTPTVGNFDEIKHVDVSVAVLDPTRKKKQRVLGEASSKVLAENLDTPQALTITDAEGNAHKIEVAARPDFWRESDFRLGGLKVDVVVKENEAITHQVDDEALKLKGIKRVRKTQAGIFKGSMTYKVSEDRHVIVTLKPHTVRKEGPRPRKKWEGIVNTIVERRRHDTMGKYTVFEPKAGWSKGAARFLEFDGRAEKEAEPKKPEPATK